MTTVQSIERAFSILEAVASYPNGLGVTDIARQVALPKSTVARLVATLESLDAVERLPDSEGFRLGPGILSMALQVPYRRHLIALTRPTLLSLAEATGEAVSLCLPDGHRVHYVDQVQSQHHIQVRDWTGCRFPIHVVSPGKLFMAYWDTAVLNRYLSRPLERFTPGTITDADVLRQQMAQIRARGVVWTINEFEEGLAGVAAPIHDKTGQIVAALNIYGPTFRFPAGNQAQITELITAAGRSISTRLQTVPAITD